MSARPKSETLDELTLRLAREGHGHVIRRRDGKMKCSGPVYCKICRAEKAFVEQLKEKEGRM